MLFNSIPFLIFAALFFAVWPLVQKNNHMKWIWICLMSFVFYAWWDWRFLFLLIGTGTVDYVCGKQILNSVSSKKIWLYISVISNLACLGIFKYYNWFSSELNALFAAFNLKANVSLSVSSYSLVLPVGISFYTFNSLSYTIDLYRGKAKAAKNWLHFMAFISFFPHLVAGPIIRARDILQQLERINQTKALKVYNGFKTVIWGFFQKMVLADNLAVFVNNRFNNIGESSDSLSWWFCMLAFAFQIYFDFNGYSSIARGIAKLCGIHFRLNFNHPYFSGSFNEFWKRWHISLSSFFKDYVYISLGGNRKGRLREELNRWITLLLSGLWHGANITFLVWGALHAFYLSIEKQTRLVLGKVPNVISWLRYPIVFSGVLIAWVLFRSPTIKDAFYIIQTMFLFKHTESWLLLFKSSAFVYIIISFFIEFGRLIPFRNSLFREWWVQVFIWSILIALTVFFRGPEQDFIYFQF